MSPNEKYAGFVAEFAFTPPLSEPDKKNAETERSAHYRE